MPQRQRPRLKRTLIKCDQCGSTALKLYPSRESVRQQLSPYHFCSSTCQRDHWEARRKAEWVAESIPMPSVRRYYHPSAGPRPAAGLLLSRVQAEGGPGAVTAESCRRGGGGAAEIPGGMAPGGESHESVGGVRRAWRDSRRGLPPGYACHQYRRSPHEAKIEAVALIPKAIRGLDGPQYVGEPSRSRAAGGVWQEWWNWWQEGRRQGWRFYHDHLAAAREATAELRKRERVAARRAETARLRRAAARDHVEDSTGSVGFSPADLELRPG